MPRHDTKHLEARVAELRRSLAKLGETSDLEEFVKIIHNPGYTTIAEHTLLQGVVDSMIEQTKSLLVLKVVLLTGAEKVELNPQPLPP